MTVKFMQIYIFFRYVLSQGLYFLKKSMFLLIKAMYSHTQAVRSGEVSVAAADEPQSTGQH